MLHLLTKPQFHFRNLAMTLAVLTVCNVHALQLGQPVIQSQQGEPLKLEVPINELSAQEAQEFAASLASASVYQAAKINRVNGLDNVRITLTKKTDDTYLMQLEGTEPLVDPYVDLLMEFRWASGRAFRNVGFPLSGATSSTAQAAAAPAPAAPAPAAEPPPAPLAALQDSMPAKPPRNAPLPKDKAVKAKPAQAEPAPADKPAASEAATGEGYEVRRGDTASGIIMANPTGDVSLDQLLVTMLRNNPRAFVDNNVNRLKAGALISLPSVDEARTIDRKEAKDSIRLQAVDFDAYRAQLAGQAAPTKLADGSEREATGGLKAQLNNNEPPPKDQLTLSKPGATDADKVSQQLEAAQAEQRNQEVTKNVNELGELSKAATKMQEGLPANASGLSAYYQQAMVWLRRYAFELIGIIALLAAALVTVSLLRDRRRSARDRDDDAADDLDFLQDPRPPQQAPELKLDFDLDLPPSQPSPVVNNPTPPASSNNFSGMQRPNPVADPVAMGEDPFKVRLDLADELWKLGQKQTGRALAQEVADQTHGEIRERALRWLNERS